MFSIILQKDLDQIPCQFNHKFPVQFYVQDVTKDVKTIFLCQQCLTMQTLPQNAKLFDKAKGKMLQQKQQSLELGKMLIQKQVQQIEQLAYEIDNYKTFIIQQIDSSKQDIKLWRQQLESFYVEEKAFNFDIEVKSLHLSQEEYQLKEHIRLAESILNLNQSYYQKINEKLHKFFDIDQFQKLQTRLDYSINKSELNILLKDQEIFQLHKNLMIQKFPNKWFLRGNFDNIEENIIYHILNWRTYRQNTEEISRFYDDMDGSQNFLSLMFPNFYKSQFHQNSVRLTPQERNEMINDEQVTEQLIENFQMYLCYSGLQLFENKIKIQNILQLQKFQNIKNMQGLQRVISSLSVLNQRQNALLLLKFLKEIDFYYNEIFIYYDLLKEEGNQNQYAFSFQQVKEYFVQSDLLDEKWVTHKILTNQILDV
ncbi:unnamed protein product [Paramecium pentaurelia]|uniref:Uncharacterized protein n=1 Tax=Paramecium pentaurelia TaxID=43138 RepID=A0A8S1Y763_9CILI|nr:unnamed protein product [Paramecium pentaurelia]